MHNCSPTILIFENRSRWMPELQRQFSGESIKVHGCRSLADVSSFLKNNPQSVVLLDFEASSAECLQSLGHSVNHPAGQSIVLMASPKTAHLEWSARELGATEFLVEQLSGQQLARLCQRLLISQRSTNTSESFAVQ